MGNLLMTSEQALTINSKNLLFKESKGNAFDQKLKTAVWIYFFLLLFEGALRKWILPGLATPLLLVRDPVAIWILFSLWNKRMLPDSSNMILVFYIGIVGSVTAMLFGHGNLFVTIYGARILLIHFPMMFAIGKIFSYEDVIKIGKITLWISIPMAILIALQFYSPQSAFVNRGVGGDEAGAGFSGALGFFRPPATFSFTNGTTLFFGFVAPFVVYFWLNPNHLNKTVLVMATIALISAIPLSISRTLLFSIVVTIFFAFSATIRNPVFARKLILAAIIMFIGILVLSQIGFFKTAIEAFTSRFDAASSVEGGLEGTFFNRYLGAFTSPFVTAFNGPFFGYGIGLGTSVGSLLQTGTVTYIIAEGEWGRLIGELGPFMGIAVIFSRLSFCIGIFRKGYNHMVNNDILTWLLLSYGLFVIPQAQWAQPTALGFSTVIGGLFIASLKNPAFQME
jgi:hypothetical protein